MDDVARGRDDRPEAVVREVQAPRGGVVAGLGAIRIGVAALHLGAGRRTKEDSIDHAVGIVCLKNRGDTVAAGEAMAEVHARDVASAEAAAADVLAGYRLADDAPSTGSIVLEVLR